MNAVSKGFHPLRAILEKARVEQKCSSADLTVLSERSDPYRLDTRAGHRDGAWIAEQLQRAVGPVRRIHWRGLHYAVVAAGDIIKPDGEVYRNTDDDWRWLSDIAGKSARWLGYVPFERITDNRNSSPVIHRTAKVTPERWVSIQLDIEIPSLDDIDPFPGVSDFEGRQPYAIAIFGEKASLEDVLLPIARRYQGDLYLCSGEPSDTLVHQMGKDAVGDGRPLVVVTVCDFDPSGHQMSVSIGRKLQAFRDLLFPELQFEIVPAALTVEQVRELGLPSTPLKETEKRADKWREVFGVEQTEIDALATLRPSDLQRIVDAAIEPYFDEGLDGRVSFAKYEWREAAQEALEEQIDPVAMAAIRERAAVKLEEIRTEIDSINQSLRMAVDDIVVLPDAVVPAPEIGPEKKGRQAPLISSSQSWAEATRRLRARKSYGGAGGES
jgi:hypothetical protein